MYKHLPLQDPPKITQNWIFGLKIHHLATLRGSSKHFLSKSFDQKLENFGAKTLARKQAL
jgi:hypothetical protein